MLPARFGKGGSCLLVSRRRAAWLRRQVAGASRFASATARPAPSIARGQILIALMVVSIASARLIAAESMGNPYAPHNSRDEAVRLIPFDKLTPEIRGKVTSVIRDVSIYRCLPTQTVDCEPDLFRFLMTNPDVLVNIWHVNGISKIAVYRIGPDQFHCADGDGTTANVDVVYRGPQVQVIYAEGLYDCRCFRDQWCEAECVAVLQYTNTRMANGRYEETAHLYTFMSITWALSCWPKNVPGISRPAQSITILPKPLRSSAAYRTPRKPIPGEFAA